MKLHTRMLCLVSFSLLVSSCSTPPAPVEERSTSTTASRSTSELVNGRYRVNRGETLYSIAFKYGLDWKDVAGWNGIGTPYTIYPGQELNLTAPPVTRRTSSPRIATRAAGRAPTATTRSADPQPATPVPDPASTQSRATTTSTQPQSTPSQSAPAQTQPQPSVATAPQAPAPAPSGTLQDPTHWLWPTDGRVTSTFSSGDPSRKGINITGREGQDVVASAAGDVVYSGNGLIGFGELIIVKHSDRMLTAYAHNRQRLVQEGQRVAAGQKIAEMGRNEQEVVMLHFELRVVGKPVNPLQYLPSR
ncbi:MAG TPA: peptidoglycan DD-metalloendopeptidase family protein [Xanthomonadales bacterium]|nr:peptidoglycan DD-metalloendopeptidase family protein [Xanthomonadales bacterium]